MKPSWTIWTRFAPVILVLAALQNTISTAIAEQVRVELELVLSADASSSIRGNEFELQVHGYASAFRDPLVIDAIMDLGGNGIAVMFVQWSASFQQFDVVDWTRIRTRGDALAFADAIENQARRFTGFATATGSAMIHAADAIDTNGFVGARKVIDISSDERSNHGRHPASARDDIVPRGMTINGLAVLDDDDDMVQYFKDHVIGGPDAFVVTVGSFEDFAEAIKLKLVREISSNPLAGLDGSWPNSRVHVAGAATAD